MASIFRSYSRSLSSVSYFLRSSSGGIPSFKSTALLTTLSLTNTYYYFSASAHPLCAESSHTSSSSKSQSSSLIRQASPAALRRPSIDLVFLSLYDQGRSEWHDWIGYFREAGYDCFDMNVALEGSQHDSISKSLIDEEEKKNERLSDNLTQELTTQLRLLSLKRLPLVFAQSKAWAGTIASLQMASRDPRMSALVIMTEREEQVEQVQEKLKQLGLHRLRVLVMPLQSSGGKAESIRKVEKWMVSEGLA